jgi:hypothetical protein
LSSAGRRPTSERRSSAATYLPGAVGLLLLAAGTLGAAQHLGGWTIGLAAASALIAAAGFAARVTRIESCSDGVAVHYGWRPSFELAWHEVMALIPPRWPLGGWRLTGQGRARVLMPSDLWGQEALLDDVISQAKLRFKDGAWRSS